MTAQSLLAGLIVIDVDEFHDELDRRVDWIGSVLVTSGLVLVVFVLSDGEIAPQKWKNACGYVLRAGFFECDFASQISCYVCCSGLPSWPCFCYGSDTWRVFTSISMQHPLNHL